MNNIHSNRIAWIDIMKGILFSLVVLGHILTTIPTPAFLIGLYDFFSPFRMPAYFFISGLLFSNRRLKTYPQYLRSKTKTLLLPYISFSFLFLLLDWNLYIENDYLTISLKRILIEALSAYKSQPLWFVFTLYLVCLIYYPCHRWVIKYRYFSIILSGIFIFLSYIMTHTSIHLPFNLGTVISAMPFFIWGVYSKEFILKITLTPLLQKIGLISIFLALYVTLYCTCNIGGRLFENQINNYFIFYFIAILGIIWFCILCSMLAKIPSKIVGIFENIARNALIILGTHGYILIIETFLYEKILISYNRYMVFIFVISILIITEIICIALANKYFYIFMGKKKLSFKESLSISRE